MKFLVTGISGQLGFDVCKYLRTNYPKIEYKGVGIEDFDITDRASVESCIDSFNPNIIIHCAAYTAVDAAEDNEELAMQVNAVGSKYIAEQAKKKDIKLLYVSTDYVFNGKGEEPFKIEDETAPLNIYGKSKLAGEIAVKEEMDKYFIVRTSWVFGENGKNFIKTMINLSKDKTEINVIDDQIGSPTYTPDLAAFLTELALTENYGTYHATNEGFCSWADLAEYSLKVYGASTKINRIPTSSYPTRAKRPLNSRLDKSDIDRIGLKRLPSWQNAVERFIEQLKSQN